MNPELITWLLESDPSIRWQVQRDLLNASPAKYEAEQESKLIASLQFTLVAVLIVLVLFQLFKKAFHCELFSI